MKRRVDWELVAATVTVLAATLAASLLASGCSAPMIAKQYDIRVYQYGVGDNNVKSDFLKETSVDPSVNVKR